MKVLELIFYILGLIPILYEFSRLTDPKSFVKMMTSIKTARKEKRKVEYTKEENLVLYTGFFFFIWSTVGLFSFQWPAFLFLWITSILTSILPKRVWITIVDSIITIFIVLGIMINSRVRIDLVEQIIILIL